MTINPASMPTIPPDSKDASPLQATVGELPIGSVQKVGDYKVLGVLGSGGMGIVYKAFDQKLGRIVALKMLQVGREASPEEILRFRSEAEMLGRLQHPNIVQIFDFGIHDGAPYLVMEFVNGGSLDKRLESTPQPPRRAAEWIEQLARAMHAAHEAKVVHRDLKPGNVLMTVEGAPKITDFGLAKQLEVSHGLTQTGAIMGTPSYMAPEQAEGKKDVGPAADVYSLGAILYECLTGRPPFRGATLQETLEQVCHADPAPPSRLVPRLPRDLQTVCLKCLHKAPGRRYASALELADDLKSWLDGLPVKARPTHSIERLLRIVQRRPLRAAFVATCLLAVILAVVLGFVVREMHQRDELAKEQQKTEHLQARQEAADRDAERAKEEAERSLRNLKGLIRLTMSGDLSTSHGLRRLEKALHDHAADLKHQENAHDKALVLADAFAKLAMLWSDMGEGDLALQSLNQAEQLARPVAENGHGDLDAQLLRGRILQQRGLLRADTAPEEAVKDCRNALELLDRVKREGASKPEFARLRAEALHDLAVATAGLPAEGEADRKKNGEAAEASHLEALRLLRKLVAGPDASDADRRNLARTLGYLGDVYLDLNRRQEADAAYWESHRIREKLAGDDESGPYEARYQLAWSWDNLGQLQTRQRILGSALYFFRQSHDLRRKLHEKQPDNAGYLLDLAWESSRIAELELFTAEAAKDLTRLAETQKQMGEAAVMVERLIASLLRSSSAGDRATRMRAYSRLGECRVLQARAAMILADQEPDPERKSKHVADARVAARAASDAYQKLSEARDAAKSAKAKDEAAAKKGEPVSPLNRDELYQQAAAQLISLEGYFLTQGRNIEDRDSYYKPSMKALRRAFELGFCRLAPEEVRGDRAFRAVVKQEWFAKLLAPPAGKAEAKSAGGSGKDG